MRENTHYANIKELRKINRLDEIHKDLWLSTFEEKDKRIKDLYLTAKPLCDWLKENGNPHTMIIVEGNRVRVTEDVMGFPVND